MPSWSYVGEIVDAPGRQVQAVFDTATSLTTKTYTGYFNCTLATGSAAASLDDVLSAPGLPALGTYIGLGSSAYHVTAVQPQQRGPTMFQVQVTAVCKDSTSDQQQPTKYNINIRVSGAPYTEDVDVDKDGNGILDSAGVPYSPSIPHEYADEAIEITYSSLSDQSAAFTTVRKCVNKTTLSFNIKGISRTFAPRFLKCEEVEQSVTIASPIHNANGTTTNPPPVYTVTATFLARYDQYGFVTRVVDQGLYKKAASGGTATVSPILDDHGKAVNTQVLLDGSGNPLQPGSAPHMLQFKIEDEADFTTVFTGLL